MTFVVRTPGDPQSLITSVAGAVHALDPELPVADVRTMDEVVDATLARPRVIAVLLTAFALMALALAGVGVYGVMAYSVAQRTREIGVRMALGATPQSVFRLVLGEGLRLVVIGVAAGLLAAGALTRLVETLLYDTPPLDPLTFALTALRADARRDRRVLRARKARHERRAGRGAARGVGRVRERRTKNEERRTRTKERRTGTREGRPRRFDFACPVLASGSVFRSSFRSVVPRFHRSSSSFFVLRSSFVRQRLRRNIHSDRRDQARQRPADRLRGVEDERRRRSRRRCRQSTSRARRRMGRAAS